MKFPVCFLLLSLILIWFSTGCYYDNNEELHPELLVGGEVCDTTVTIKYSTDIQPILDSSCGSGNSCHNASASSGVVLAAYAGTRAVALDGRLWSAIVWDGNASFMPQGSSSKINACYQAKIRKWIDEGAPDN